MTSVRDSLANRNKLLRGFKEKEKALMADNVKQKEELDKVKAEAVDKVLQDLGKKYFEATK